MNRKGFTLVELIAMMVVIGILMAITIPNITGIIQKNREEKAIGDIDKIIGNVKAKMDSGKVEKPGVNECVVFTLKSADTNDDIGTGLNGGNYDMNKSFIVVTRKTIENELGTSETSEYKYFFHLRELKQVKDVTETYMSRGFSGWYALTDYDLFVKNPKDHFPTLASTAEQLNLDYYVDNPDGIKWELTYMWKNGKTYDHDEYESITDYLCTKVLAIYIK